MIKNKVIYEAILVGIYSILIYLILIPFEFTNNVLFYMIGFLKHFLAYNIGIETYYCNNGNVCIKDNKKRIVYSENILIESIIEGYIYIIICMIIYKIINNYTLTIFYTGFILHIVFELTGVHNYFCKNNCL